MAADKIVGLRKAIQAEFDRRSQEKLHIKYEEAFATRRIAVELNRQREDEAKAEKEYIEAAKAKGALPHKPRQPMPKIQFKKADEIAIGDILNNKTHRKGVYFDVEATVSDAEMQSLADAMQTLKDRAEADHKAMDRIGSFREKKEKGLPDQPEYLEKALGKKRKNYVDDSKENPIVYRSRGDKIRAEILERGPTHRKPIEVIIDLASPSGNRRSKKYPITVRPDGPTPSL